MKAKKKPKNKLEKLVLLLAALLAAGVIVAIVLVVGNMAKTDKASSSSSAAASSSEADDDKGDSGGAETEESPAQTQAPAPARGSSGGLPVEMVRVGGGSFQMGKQLNSGSGYSDVTPTHMVTLTGFYIGKYEITQAQWQAIVGDNPSLNPSRDYGVGDNYPVYNVSWYRVLAFCNRLSMAEGLTPAYRINGGTNPSAWGNVPTSGNSSWDVEIVSGSTGYRLPTEAQWEYAAKGGNGSPGNYTYAGSNNVGDVAWHEGNSGGKTHAIGTKAPNSLGLYDMSGNVWEWCWSGFGNYSNRPQTDPMTSAHFGGGAHVVRGGSWLVNRTSAPSANRHSRYPYERHEDQGFRVVRPL